MKQAQRRDIIRAGTTVEHMVRAISGLIVTGSLKPGDKLDEGSLASRFDVSRTPVREALRQLGAMGLVKREPNRSAVVTTVDADHLNSMFEAMAELEGICARLAALRMTAEERHTLEAEHLASHRLIQDGAEEDYAAYNTRFHTALYRGAHNEHIYDLVTQTRARLAPFRRAQFHLAGRLVRSFEEHEAIVTAIMRADGNAAGAAAYAHVAIVRSAAASIVANPQVFADL